MAEIEFVGESQGCSGRPGFLKFSFPSQKLSRTFYFSSTAFVVGEQTSDTKRESQDGNKEVGNPGRR